MTALSLRRRLVLLWPLLVCPAENIIAATINSTWSGGASGNWAVAGNWTPMGIPNNGSGNIYNVAIPSPSAVTVNGSFTIEIFDLDPGASTLISPGQILTLNAGPAIDGTLTLGVHNNFSAARLRLGGNLSTAGTGAIELRGVAIFDSPAGGRLTIGAGNTVHGLNASGGFELSLTNAGALDFEGAGSTNFNHPDGSLINSGTFRVRNGATANISAINNGITLENSNLFEVDAGTVVLQFANVTNTGTMRVKNSGLLRNEGFTEWTNTGGIWRLESNGRWVPGTVILSGGEISGDGTGVIDLADFNAQTLTLNGGTALDPFEIADVLTRIGPGRVLTFGAGHFTLDDASFAFGGEIGFPNGGQVAVSGAVTMNGTGSFASGTTNPVRHLVLQGATAGDSLILGAGITIATSAQPGNASISVNTTTAGPITINNPALFLSSTLTATGTITVGANSVLDATGSTALLVLQNNTTQLGAGAQITGKLSLNGATISGAGELAPSTLQLSGTNTVGTPIRADSFTVTANGAAVVDGNGKIATLGSSGTITLNPAAPGATLTTGPDFDLEMTSGHTLVANLPWRFQGEGALAASVFTLAADFENDGVLNITGSSQLNLNKSIVAGSTGSITTGSSTTVNVNGASTLDGAFFGSGNFAFSGSIVVTVADYNGSGAITLNNGAKANFSDLVPSVSTLTVNSNNANVSFNGGLTSVGNVTINGSGGIFAVTGNTIATGLLRVQGNSTHGGFGTTTAQGTVEYTGKLDGRTLIAQGPTTAFQVTLQNNAVFENLNTLTLFNFGTPNTFTGAGILRNKGILLQSDLFGPNPNIISTTFEQTATGTMTVAAELTLNGNSTIAGTVNIPVDTKLILTSGATNTTHAISGQITGAGTFEVAGNTLFDAVTGTEPTATLTGSINLTGANSTVTVASGATVVVETDDPTTTALMKLDISGQIFSAEFVLVCLAEGLFNLRHDRGFFDGPDMGPRLPIQTALLTAEGSDIDACTIRNIDLVVEQTCTTQGLVDLRDSTLEIGSDCAATSFDGTQLISTTGDGEVHCNGGDWLIPAGSTVQFFADGIFDNTGFELEDGATCDITGTTVWRASAITVAPGATDTLAGPTTLVDCTITAEAGSGPNPGGAISITDPQEIRNTTIVVQGNADAEVTAPVDENLRQQMRDFKLRMESPGGTLLQQAQLENIFFSGSQTGLGGNGCFTTEQLVPAGARIALEAGASPGQLQVYGNLPLGPGSDMYIELGGTTQITQYDLLSVAGVLTATNTSLRPRFINNFQSTITPANTFTVIETTQPIVGTFFNVFGGRVMAADGSGTFSVTMANGNTHVVLGDFIPGDVIDSDMDGMSDEFENEFFGSPTGGVASDDTDGDGKTNLEEYRSGTNPIDATSVLRIKEIRRQGNNVVVVFDAAADKSYRVEADSDLTGSYPIVVATIAATPTAGTREAVDVGAVLQAPRFYQVVLVP